MKICEKFLELYKKNPESFRLWAFLILFYISIFIFFYLLYQYNKNSKIRLKIFSIEFSKLISRNANSVLEYNGYLKGRKLTELKSHSDFYWIRSTRFLSSLMDGIEGIMIPADANYGLCAILIANYCKIREEIALPMFVSEARFNLLKIFLMCDEMQLNTILSKNQDLVSKHERVLDYNYWDLSSVLAFVKLYFLYLYSLEDPATARNLNARNFYSFSINHRPVYYPHVYYQPSLHRNHVPKASVLP